MADPVTATATASTSAQTSFVTKLAGILGAAGYPGVFFALFFAGWLIPLPEEPLLIAAGYLAYSNQLNVWIMIVAAMTGLLCGDLVIFWIGRRHGDWVFRLRLFRWLLPEDRLAKARKLFAENGSKMSFFGRFIAGVRLVVFFTAGNLGVPVLTFIFYDFLAAMLTIPVSVWAGWYFGSKIDEALLLLHRWRNLVFMFLIALALSMLLTKLVRARRKLAADAAAPPPPPPATTPPAKSAAEQESKSWEKRPEHA